VANAIERVSSLLEEQNHFLDLVVPSRGLTVLGDEDRLSQVLTNLLANAARYTSPGGCVRIVATAAGEQVQLSVQDNGMGIERDLLPRIFDLFVQGRRALDRRGGGLGLGLAVVKRIVELHGGTVEAFSDGPGRGTELRLSLPRAAEALADAPATSPAPAGPPPALARGTRVLIVDDNEDAGVILGEALRRHGYEVGVAPDGPTALRLAATSPPQVALLDIGLPVMDGYEVARRLRAQLAPAKVKLVAITGYGRESDRLKTRAAGFDLHLTKPVDLDVVLGALVRL
jgi:CheY-like chemotaxis protein